MTTHKPLSKTQYTKGLQCAKALWLHRHRKDLAAAPDPFQESIMEAGTEFGALARQRWPGGTLIKADHMHHEEALAQTAAAIADGANVLYEAAFEYNGVVVRVDVIERVGAPSAGDLWFLYEVKAGTKVEAHHLDDVAIQRYVMDGAGHKVVEAHIVHANGEYVRRGALDLQDLFTIECVTTASLDALAGLPTIVDLIKVLMDAPEAPARLIGEHCAKPYPCEFKAHCWAGIPEYSVFNIPYLKMDRKLALYNRGVQRVDQVNPDMEKITDKRSRAPIEAARLGKPAADRGAIAKFLNGLTWPIAHLDFETDNPPVPPYDGLRPYSQMPFQASVRVQLERGAPVVEKAFLGDGRSDPRAALAEFLGDAVPTRGTVLAYYKPFEEGRLRELATDGSVLKAPLTNLLVNMTQRLQDLADPFSKNWYTDPAFKGRWSIKAVAPILAPDSVSYKGLLVHDGAGAIAAYGELRDPATTPARRAELAKALTVYCGMDTLAMAGILAFLEAIVAGGVAA